MSAVSITFKNIPPEEGLVLKINKSEYPAINTPDVFNEKIFENQDTGLIVSIVVSKAKKLELLDIGDTWVIWVL